MTEVVGVCWARMNSTRVPKKITEKFGDMTLIEIAMRRLNAMEFVNRAVLYTSDPEIKDYIPDDVEYDYVERPKFLNNQDITETEIVRELHKQVKSKSGWFLSVGADSPFATPAMYRAIWYKLAMNDHDNRDSGFLATELKRNLWWRGLPLNFDPSHWPKSQDLDPVIKSTGNGMWRANFFEQYQRRQGFYPYFHIVSEYEIIDIDWPEDLEFARSVYDQRGDEVFGLQEPAKETKNGS